MSAIQRFSYELTTSERQFATKVQFGIACLFSVTSYAMSFFKKANISPQFALAGGLASLVVSNLTDCAFKAFCNTNHDDNRSMILTGIKTGLIAGMIAVSLDLTQSVLHSYNIPIGDANAISMLAMAEIIISNQLF